MSGITRRTFGNRRFGGDLEVTGKMKSQNNVITVVPGECIPDGWASGTLDIITQGLTYAASAAAEVFHLGKALFQSLLGASIKITKIIVFFANSNINTFYDDFTFGHVSLNPAMSIDSDYTDPNSYGTETTGNQNHEHDPINVTLTNTNLAYAIQMDITVVGGQTFELLGFKIYFDTV